MNSKAQLSWNDEDQPVSQRFGDTYYSREDGRAECAHVFLDGNGLPERWANTTSFNIGELGFGTGLNFLETWRQWIATRTPNQNLHFVSVEGFLMQADEAERALAAWPKLATLTTELLSHWGQMGNSITIDDQTKLTVYCGPADEALPRFPNIDAWYLDGFSPALNPEMWSEDLMQIVGSRTAADGTCASYTAAGWVRRNLDAAGFDIKKVKGFGRKRDMIVGKKVT